MQSVSRQQTGPWFAARPRTARHWGLQCEFVSCPMTINHHGAATPKPVGLPVDYSLVRKRAVLLAFARPPRIVLRAAAPPPCFESERLPIPDWRSASEVRAQPRRSPTHRRPLSATSSDIRRTRQSPAFMRSTREPRPARLRRRASLRRGRRKGVENGAPPVGLRHGRGRSACEFAVPDSSETAAQLRASAARAHGLGSRVGVSVGHSFTLFRSTPAVWRESNPPASISVHVRLRLSVFLSCTKR